MNCANHPDAAVPADIPGAGGLVSLQSQLSQAQAQADSLADRYGPNYPPLEQARAQVTSLKNTIEELRRTLMKSAAENLERVQKADQSITDRLDALQKEAEGRTPDTVKYEILKSQYLSDQNLYNILLGAMGTGAIQAGMQSQELNRFTAACWRRGSVC